MLYALILGISIIGFIASGFGILIGSTIESSRLAVGSALAMLAFAIVLGGFIENMQ